MDQVRFAGSAGLPFMVFEREFVGFTDDFEVVLGAIGGDFGLQLLEFGSQAWIWRDGKRVSRHVRLYLKDTKQPIGFITLHHAAIETDKASLHRKTSSSTQSGVTLLSRIT